MALQLLAKLSDEDPKVYSIGIETPVNWHGYTVHHRLPSDIVSLTKRMRSVVRSAAESF